LKAQASQPVSKQDQSQAAGETGGWMQGAGCSHRQRSKVGQCETRLSRLLPPEAQ